MVIFFEGRREMSLELHPMVAIIVVCRNISICNEVESSLRRALGNKAMRVLYVSVHNIRTGW